MVPNYHTVTTPRVVYLSRPFCHVCTPCYPTTLYCYPCTTLKCWHFFEIKHTVHLYIHTCTCALCMHVLHSFIMVYGLMCVFSISLFSCVFPDPSLTPENLSTVLDNMEDRQWLLFSRYVNIPDPEREKIGTQYSSDRERRQVVIDSFISTHPAPSWRLVAHTLYRMGVFDDGERCHRALDHLQQLFPTGTNMHEHTCTCNYAYTCT